MIKTPHLAMTQLFDASIRWSLYLNPCVTALSSEDVGVPGAMMQFSMEPILLKLEGGKYVGPLLPDTLEYLVSERRGGGGSGGSSGGDSGGGGTEGDGGAARVRVRYEVHLPALSLRYRKIPRTFLEGTVLLKVHGHVNCKKWHLCRLLWEDIER